MAGGINWGAGQQMPIPPTNAATPDAGVTPLQVNVSKVVSKSTTIFTPGAAEKISQLGVDRANEQLALVNRGPTTSSSTATNASMIKAALGSVGVNFAPEDNPLNQYANYTYHIRWFMTSDSAAYNIDPANPNADNLNKTVIAESGITAGFNISEFELTNSCGPNSRVLNTTNFTWTMTVLEPFGISLLDRIRSAAATQPIINYMRAPYFIDVWFTGYDEDGNIVAPNLFYQLYRVAIHNMDVDLTEGGSRYVVTGGADGGIAHANQISMPPAMTEIKAKTVGEFFKGFADKLTEQNKTINERDYATVEYEINVPPEIKDWTLRNQDVDKQNNRNDDMDISYQDGTMRVKVNRGTSIENVVNHVVSMSPEADKWVKSEGNGGTAGGGGTDIASNGIATWLMVHGQVKIIGWDAYTREYIRKVTYTLIPYKTIKSGADKPTITNLEKEQVQKAKLNFLASKNALKKLYQYIYTGENTEIIKYDIHVENLWSVTLPLWEATNTYNNYVQGPTHNPNSVASAKIRNQYSKKQQVSDLQGQITQLDTQLNSATSFRQAENLIDQKADIQQQIQNIELSQKGAVYYRSDLSPGALAADSALLQQDKTVAAATSRYSTLAAQEKALRYAEDLQSLPGGKFDPMPIVMQPDNQPQDQNADRGGDANKAIANTSSQGLPAGRSFTGSILGNMFSPAFFNEINLEIRGDPYWMGQSNIRENAIADSFGQSGSDPNFANYVISDHMLVLVFRSGENYNEDTGLMQFDTTSDFFNGAYGVINVINSFKGGAFTQTLHAFKDPYGQKVSNELTSAATGSSPTTPSTPSSAAVPSADNSMPQVDIMGNATGF